MNVNLDGGWAKLLSPELEKPYFKTLRTFVSSQYKNHTCYPQEEAIFAAFNCCEYDAVKVVIIGQDPYHGPNEANGLCFSVNDGIKHPPSLVNIFKEIQSDLKRPYPKSGNLERWAKQGVLLINATLTVRSNEAGSHQKKGWEQFTDAVIQKLSDSKTGLVFLLWGGFAKKKMRLIDKNKHHILTTGHPSPLSANRGCWFGNQHFSKTNAVLHDQNNKPIDW